VDARPNDDPDCCWLVNDGHVLASLEIAERRSERMRGLLGRDGLDGALMIPRCRSVHTLGMRFPIDVAFCDSDGVVIRMMSLDPRRMTLPVWRAKHVIEVESGAFARWGVSVGDRLEVR
jgi:uncharacterized membrane protein (UPF0127 family)